MPSDIHLDVCGLEPPEPMVQVLDALAALAPGQRVHMVINREPRPLFRILEANGFAFTSEIRPDFLYQILIWQRP